MVEHFLSRLGGQPLIEVQIKNVKGSAPRGTDAFMLVSKKTIHGTIGGGTLELLAIQHARAMLLAGEIFCEISHALGPEINQCCGGFVTLHLTLLDEKAKAELQTVDNLRRASYPKVIIFGAGHVGLALAKSLALLPFQTVLTDTRPDQLQNQNYFGEHISLIPQILPETLVHDASPCTAFVVLTHDHDLDFAITSHALKRGDASYVGLIGSKTKRATFKAQFIKQGGTIEQFSSLVCPIGENITGDKRPEIIAAFVAAELCVKLLTPSNVFA